MHNAVKEVKKIKAEKIIVSVRHQKDLTLKARTLFSVPPPPPSQIEASQSHCQMVSNSLENEPCFNASFFVLQTATSL